jgi:predicted nucleic acid-binding protein
VLYAAIQREDPRHEEARRLVRTERLVLTTEVLTEFIGVTTSKLGRAAARQAFDALVARPNLVVSGELDAHRAIALHQRNPGLSFVDACVVACCEGRRCGVLAYDARIEGLVGE